MSLLVIFACPTMKGNQDEPGKPRKLERCPGFDPDMLEPNRNTNIVQKRQEESLTDTQLIDIISTGRNF
jgi:hypothetical protein